MSFLSFLFAPKESKTCKSCHHYDEWKTEDRLTTEKQLIKGKVDFSVCGKSKSKLKDFTPCPLWERDKHDAYNKRTAALSYVFDHSKPPSGGTSILPLIK